MPSKTNITKKIAELEKLAAAKDAILTVEEETFIDDDHLDCVWYGGEIAVIEYKGVSFEISVHGDVCLDGFYNGQEIYYKNKSNTGAVGTDLFYQIPDDATLSRLLKADWEKENEDHLCCENNNWVEIFYGDTNCSDVANEDNVLAAIEEALLTIEDLFRCYFEVCGQPAVPECSGSVGAIEYLAFDGNVRERIEFSDERKFKDEIFEANHDGVPMVIIVYKNCHGEMISNSFLRSLDPPPAGFRVEKLCPFCDNGLCVMSADDNFCDGSKTSKEECAYCTAAKDDSTPETTDDPDGDNKPLHFTLTYAVKGYVEIEITAKDFKKAKELASQKVSEIDCGDLHDIDWSLHDVDWNKIESEEDD